MADEKSREDYTGDCRVDELRLDKLLETLKNGSVPEREAYWRIIEQKRKITELERIIREKEEAAKIDVDVAETIRGLKAVQREARKATRALRELSANGDVIERLAALEHEQWMAWSQAVADEVSPERRMRWRAYWVPYDELDEEAKEKDRKWARKVIEVIRGV